MNHDIVLPTYAQDKAFAEPEEEENVSPYENEDDENYTNFNFAAAGDFGCNSNAKNTVRNMKDLGPDLIVALGDLSYQSSSKCWLDMISPLEKESDVRISIGYHDVFDGTSGLLQSYFRHFNLQKQFYSFNYRNVHFLAMATEIDYSEGSEQFNFVVNDLKKASGDSNIK